MQLLHILLPIGRVKFKNINVMMAVVVAVVVVIRSHSKLVLLVYPMKTSVDEGVCVLDNSSIRSSIDSVSN